MEINVERYLTACCFKEKGDDTEYMKIFQVMDGYKNVLETELRDRLLKISINIKKCGSYKKMRELGGERTDMYLIVTRNLVKFYITEYIVRNMKTTKEEATDTMNTVNEIPLKDLDRLVAKASFEAVEEFAEPYRKALIERYCIRLLSRDSVLAEAA